MSLHLQVVGFVAFGVVAAWFSIVLTRAAFKRLSKGGAPRVVDRAIAGLLLLGAISLPVLATVPTVSAIDALQEHRRDSMTAFYVVWLPPVLWYFYRRRPPN